MKSCKILRYGAVCGLAALAAVGCSVDDAETIRVRELTAAEHELFVPASGGTAQIQLYSNGRVRVEALSDIGGWASVDRSEFDGDRMVSVTFTENDSFRRMAKLRFVLDVSDSDTTTTARTITQLAGASVHHVAQLVRDDAGLRAAEHLRRCRFDHSGHAEVDPAGGA